MKFTGKSFGLSITAAVAAISVAVAFNSRLDKTPAPLGVPSITAEAPVEFITPLAPGGLDPITWDNIESRSDDISVVAWQSAQDTLKVNSSGGSTSVIKVLYAPNTAQTHYPGFESYIRTGVTLWNRFQTPRDTTFLVYSYEEIPWAELTITQILSDSGMDKNRAAAEATNLSRAPYGGPDCGGANSGMIGPTQGVGVFGLCPRNEGTDPYYNGPLQIHEFTHQMQGSQFANTNLNSQDILPCWISEGLAHLGGLTAGTTTIEDYLKVRSLQTSHPQLGIAGGSSSSNAEPSTMTLEFLKKYYAESSPPGCFQLSSYSLGYSAGFLTTEALAAIGGVESTLLLFTRTSQGETFEQAFENIYGIDWETAQAILASTVSQEFAAL